MQQQESLGLDGDEYALRPGQAQGEPSASRAESPSLIPESPSRIPDSPSPAANGLAWVESFDRFWSAWPTHERKVDRGSCLAKWKKLGLHRIAHQVIAHVEAMKQSQSWQDGFVPLPMTYLNQARWEGAAPLGRPAPAGKQATLEARNRAAADSAKAKLFGTAPDAGAPHG